MIARRRSATEVFRRFSHRVSVAVGAPWAFIAAVIVVLFWIVTGPLFRYSDAWQLSINTGTTIITFLMVFVIQNTQNRDSQVAQLKLDELIRAVRKARNELVDLEALPDAELERLHRQFAELRRAALHRARGTPTDSSRRQPDHESTLNRRSP
jgi:low affinity Fe/Cu permease